MRVTLVKPPEHSQLNFGCFSLAVLAAAVRDVASVKIIDATNLSVTESVKTIISCRPDLIGITTMGRSSVVPASALITSLRHAGFEGLIIVGGHGATMLPRIVLEKGADAVVYGEGETSFKELLLFGVSKRLKGLFLLQNGELVKTTPQPLIQPLDQLDEPARDLIPPPANGVTLLETSRGCPHSCIFCETSRFYNQIWRARSPEIVAKDIRRLVTHNKATVILVADDNFMANPKRVIQICELIQDGPLPLFFMFSARSDDLMRTPKLIPALTRANFLRATIGVETVDTSLAHHIQKPIPFNQHKQAFTALKNAGIYTVASFIVGLPNETEETRQHYLDAAVELGTDAARFLPFQPLPGTPVANELGEPDFHHVEIAEKITKLFERHPIVMKRLLDTAKEPSVRGMLARSSLQRRLKEKSLDENEASKVRAELGLW
jgi:anaerobic magnesium-protoporphyrin IX monomethyl ester cyclase